MARPSRRICETLAFRVTHVDFKRKIVWGTVAFFSDYRGAFDRSIQKNQRGFALIQTIWVAAGLLVIERVAPPRKRCAVEKRRFFNAWRAR